VGRFNTGGSIDPTFGTGGLVNTLIGSSNTADGVAFQADGRIVVAGTSPWNSSGGKFALARYLGDSTAPSAGILAAPPATVSMPLPAEVPSSLDAAAASLLLELAQKRRG
jgi:hypothetical protein